MSGSHVHSIRLPGFTLSAEVVFGMPDQLVDLHRRKVLWSGHLHFNPRRTIMGVPVSFDDLRMAFEWVSAPGAFEHCAYVSRASGEVHWATDAGDEEEELPENVDDESLYAPVPHKREFDLGSHLAFQFVRERLPHAYDRVKDIFGRSGAYGRFKHLLEREGQLEAWYAYEEQAVETALREWAGENDFELSQTPRADGH